MVTAARSSSREARIRAPYFSVVCFSRETLPKKVKGTTGGPRLAKIPTVPTPSQVAL